MRFVGTPYIWGGDDPILGMDCSGFAQEVLASIGFDPDGDQTAHGLYNYLKMNGLMSSRSKGALAFYGSSKRITHVAICLDDMFMIEAGGGGSKTTTKEAAAKHNAYIRVRPIDRRKDLVECILPRY